jgi:pilus assembly protein CpaB
MGRRTLLLIASILVAALGTALIWLYVQGADSRAQAGEAQVKLMVAAQPVSPGTPADKVSWTTRSFPRDYALALGGTAITTQQALQAAGVATTLIPANVPLLLTQFGPPAAATDVAPAPLLSNLTTGKEAITLTLPDPQRLAGLLQPNSLIRVYVTSASTRGTARTWVLLDRVRVLSSGPATGTTTGDKAAVPQANVALEVDDKQAKRVINAMSVGGGSGGGNGGGNSLWFALLGPGRVDPVGTGPGSGLTFVDPQS